MATLSAAGLVALTVAVVVLVVLALQHGDTVPASSGPRTNVATDSPTVPATPTDTPTTSSPTPETSGGERFLALGGAHLWRATAGACDDEPPVVEVSADDGETWQDVTPTDATRVLALSSYGDIDGELVVADTECAPTLLRTYSAGVDWSASADLLPDATYASPTEAGTILVGGSTVTTPCDEPTSVRASRGTVGLICEGTAYVMGEEWTAVVDGVIALDAVGGALVAAFESDECSDGVEISTFEGSAATSLGCMTGVDPTLPAALSALDGEYVLWSGDEIIRL